MAAAAVAAGEVAAAAAAATAALAAPAAAAVGELAFAAQEGAQRQIERGGHQQQDDQGREIHGCKSFIR